MHNKSLNLCELDLVAFGVKLMVKMIEVLVPLQTLCYSPSPSALFLTFCTTVSSTLMITSSLMSAPCHQSSFISRSTIGFRFPAIQRRKGNSGWILCSILCHLRWAFVQWNIAAQIFTNLFGRQHTPHYLLCRKKLWKMSGWSML